MIGQLLEIGQYFTSACFKDSPDEASLESKDKDSGGILF